MTKDEKLLTLKEAAERLRVSERSMFRYIHGGHLKASKVGYWRIKIKDLEAFIEKVSNTRRHKK